MRVHVWVLVLMLVLVCSCLGFHSLLANLVLACDGVESLMEVDEDAIFESTLLSRVCRVQCLD